MSELIISIIKTLLMKNGFATKIMEVAEKRALKGFLKELESPKKIKSYWVIKEGDNYKYRLEKVNNSINVSINNSIIGVIDTNIGDLYAEYIYYVWGELAIDLLRVTSLDGMEFLHHKLATKVFIAIWDYTLNHKAIVSNIHKTKVIKKIAVNKILRNSIYNNGLGLKLALRGFKNDGF